MKRITLLFAILFVTISQAQTPVFWSDLSDETSDFSLFELTSNDADVAATGALNDAVTPPATTIPNGATWIGGAVRFRSERKDTAGEWQNNASQMWVVLQSIDLTDANPLIETGATDRRFSIYSKPKAGIGTGPNVVTLGVYVATDYDGSSLPSVSGTWGSPLTPISGALATLEDADDVYQVDPAVFNLDAYAADTSVTIAVVYISNGTTWASDNQNGGYIITDPKAWVTNPTASVADNALAAAINVFPNPVSGKLNIKRLNNSISLKSTKLIDITGRVVISASSVESINVSNISKGLYILKLESTDGGVYSQKIVVN